jgi:nuclear pore complex protein Nup205
MTDPNAIVHYFPALAAYISRFGGPEGGGTVADARSLNDKLLSQAEHDSWALPYFYASFRAWWLAEYGGWYGENYDGSIPENLLEEGQLERPLHSFRINMLIQHLRKQATFEAIYGGSEGWCL